MSRGGSITAQMSGLTPKSASPQSGPSPGSGSTPRSRMEANEGTRDVPQFPGDLGFAPSVSAVGKAAKKPARRGSSMTSLPQRMISNDSFGMDGFGMESDIIDHDDSIHDAGPVHSRIEQCLSRRVLCERLCLEIQFSRACPHFLLLLSGTLIFLLALDQGRKPGASHNVGTLLEADLGLEEVERVKSPQQMFSYFEQFASASQAYHPMSATYLPDPLQKELIGYPLLFDETVVLPDSAHPELTSSFTFTTWFLLDTNEVGGDFRNYPIVKKLHPDVRNSLLYTQSEACWAWSYWAKQGYNQKWVGYQLLSYGRHLDNYHELPDQQTGNEVRETLRTEDMASTQSSRRMATRAPDFAGNQTGRRLKGRSSKRQQMKEGEDEGHGNSHNDKGNDRGNKFGRRLSNAADVEELEERSEDGADGDFSADDGPIFLAVVVDSDEMQVKFYEGGEMVMAKDMKALVTDCGDGHSSDLEVGAKGVGLATLRFHPRALTAHEIKEVSELGQPLKEIATSTVRFRSPAKQRSETRNDIQGLLNFMDASATSATQNHQILSTQAQGAPAATPAPPASSANQSAIPASIANPPPNLAPGTVGPDEWSPPIDVSREFANAFISGSGKLTITQWLSSTLDNGYQFSISRASTSSYSDQCFSLYRRREGDKPILRLVLGYDQKLTSSKLRASRYCRLDPFSFYTGNMNHYALSLEAIDQQHTFKVNLYVDGLHTCGLNARYTPAKYQEIKDCFTDTTTTGRAWTGKRAPDSGKLTLHKQTDFRIWDSVLSSSTIRVLSEESAYRVCRGASDGADDPAYRTPLDHNCAYIRKLLDEGYPSDICNHEARANCPIACRSPPLCHGGGAVPGKNVHGAWYWCTGAEAGCYSEGADGLLEYQDVGGSTEALKVFDEIVTLGESGAICMDKTTAESGTFTFLDDSGECAVALPKSEIVNPSRDAGQLNTTTGTVVGDQHCYAETLGWPNMCQFDAGRLNQLDDNNWTEFTIGFWARGRDITDAATDTLYFMSSPDRNCEGSPYYNASDPTPCGQCFALDKGIILSAWDMNGKKSKNWLSEGQVYQDGFAKIKEQWIFHALVWSASTGEMTLMVNGIYMKINGASLGCTPGLRAIVKYQGPQLAISPISVFPSALSLAALQDLYYTELKIYSNAFVQSARQSVVERSKPMSISLSRYPKGTMAVSTPMIYQTRQAKKDCDGEVPKVIMENNIRKGLKMCSGPYTCDVNDSVIIRCKDDVLSQDPHWGRDPVNFDGEFVFAEFALTIASPMLWREDGSGKEAAVDPRDWVDQGTQSVGIVHVFYTPDFEMTSVVHISFDLSSPAIVAEPTIRHIVVPRNAALIATAWVIVVIEISALVFRGFRIVRAAGGLGQETMRHADFGWTVFDFLLRCFLLLPLTWDAVLCFTFKSQFEEKMADIAGINFEQQGFREYFAAVEGVNQFVTTFDQIQTFEFFAIIISIVRIFYYLRLHPRIGLLVRTFELSSDDLMHFLLLFCFCISLLAYFSVCLFGADLADFSDMLTAMETLYFAFITGEMPWRTNSTLIMFVLFFTLIVWGFLLNLFLAIIVEAYLKVKDAINKFHAENNLIQDTINVIRYDVRATWEGWPDRYKLLQGISMNPQENVFTLEHCIADLNLLGFKSQESAEKWYMWQLNNHAMCVWKNHRERLVAQKHDAAWHFIYEQDLGGMLEGMSAARQFLRESTFNGLTPGGVKARSEGGDSNVKRGQNGDSISPAESSPGALASGIDEISSSEEEDSEILDDDVVGDNIAFIMKGTPQLQIRQLCRLAFMQQQQMASLKKMVEDVQQNTKVSRKEVQRMSQSGSALPSNVAIAPDQQFRREHLPSVQAARLDRIEAIHNQLALLRQEQQRAAAAIQQVEQILMDETEQELTNVRAQMNMVPRQLNPMLDSSGRL